MNGEAGRIVLAEVRAQDSARHNLVQLADYVTGIQRRREEKRRGAGEYSLILAAREGPCVRERL